jgi:PhnB protein
MKRKKVARKPAVKAKAAARPKAKAKPAKKKVVPIPAGYHSVTPYLVCRGASDAIDFYKKAFGAKEKVRMPTPDGKVMHAELMIGNSHLMLGDEMPQMGATAPPTIGGTSVSIFLYVKDVDRAFAQATAAGATAEMPPADMFWGDRFCKLADPFGHKWAIATHIEDVSAKDMKVRMAAAQAQAQPAGV